MDKDRVYTLKRSKKSERAIRVLRRIRFKEEIKWYFILTAAVYVIYRIFLANAFVYTGYGYINFLVGCIFLVMYGTSILYYMYLSSSWSKNEDLYKDMDKRYIGKSKNYYYFATALPPERLEDAKRKISELEEIIGNRKKGIRGNVAIVYKVRKLVIENLKRNYEKEARIDVLYDMILEYVKDDKFKLSDDPLAYVFEKD